MMYNTAMSNLECIINSGLLKYVKKSEYIEALESCSIVERGFSKGKILFHEGDVVDRICIVREGSIRTEKTYPDGGVHIVSVYEENSIFGLEITLSHKKTTPNAFVANEDSIALFVAVPHDSKNRFWQPIQKALIEHMADENIRMSHKIEILAEKSLRRRIMVFLNVLADKSEEDDFLVPMNREQMAQFLCVNRSALSNELNKMKSDGVIDFTRHRFTILK